MFTIICLFAGTAFAQNTDTSATQNKTVRLQGVSIIPGDTLSVYGRLQGYGFYENLKDYTLNNNRVYLYLKEARFGVKDHYDGATFDFQMELGGEDQTISTGVALTLLDMSADIPLMGNTFIKVGQFKVPFGREQMTYEGSFFFNDYSIAYEGTKDGRDVGAALHGNAGLFTGTLGAFTGGGIDVPLRFLPENLSAPELVGRFGINDGYDNNNLDLSQVDRGPNGYAIDVDGLFMRDSRIGHSTVLNVKTYDKNLIIDGDWNPYIGVAPNPENFSEGDYWQLGLDGGVRSTVDKETYSGEWEADYEGYSNVYGGLHLATGRAQFMMRSDHLGFGIQYSAIEPDQNFAYVSGGKTYNAGLGTQVINQIAPGVQYFFNNRNLKLGIDFPIVFNDPVVNEPGVGAYSLTDMQDQITVITDGVKSQPVRQTVVQARLQVQYEF